MKTIYHYDPATGEFLNAGEARPSPKEPGQYFIPGFATDVAPPANEVGKALVFVDGHWSAVTDNRGTWYGADHKPVAVHEIGADVSALTRAAPPGAGYELDAGTWVPSPARAEASRQAAAAKIWEAIKAERDHRTQSGGYNVGTKWYHSDTFSRTQQLGLVLLGAGIPANTQWKTMDGSFILMTQTLAADIFAAAAAADIATFAAAEAHRVAMEASADPGAYDFTAGWPAVFPE